MRAVHVHRLDGPEALALVEVPEPEAGADQVVVDVHAAGVAWPDLLMTRGRYQLRPEPPFAPGTEVAGTVRTAPPGSGLGPGTPVAVVTGAGGWQDTVVARPAEVLRLPDGLPLLAAAGVPFNLLTVQFALRRRARLQPGETVLVHGASGGVGAAGVQLARAYGARTIAVVSTPEREATAREAGADEVVLADGFLARVKELTGGRGVDVVLDPVGGDRFTDSLRSLATEGRLLVVGFTGGDIPTVKVNRLLLGNTGVVGVGWGAFLAGSPGHLQEQWAEVAGLLSEGRVRPVPGPVYDLADARTALEDMQARRLRGKAVLRLRP